MNAARSNGFTLIEMSIVLVIIGLILGGIVVGRDLIQAAAIRAQISQLQKLNTAVLAFKGKYNGLPGDLTVTQSEQFGFTERLPTPARGQGNGDGVLEGSSAVQDSDYAGMQQCGETLLFWNDLSSAGMVEQKFNTATDTGGYGGLAYSLNEIPLLLPAAKIGGGNYIMITSVGGEHFWLMAEVLEITAGISDASVNYNLIPIVSYAMDSKIDDGQPRTGKVTARGTPSFGEPTGSRGLGGMGFVDNTCVRNDAYYTTNPAAECVLGFRTSW